MTEPVSITICGTPSSQTLTDLFTIALRDGLGFVLPPRLAAPAIAIEPATERRRIPARVPRTERVARPSEPEPASVSLPLRRAVAAIQQGKDAANRREHVVGQLRRAGEAGLSFRALMAACRTVLASAGDGEQQVSALRNALTILQRDRRVKRFAGQWIAVGEQESGQ